MKKKNLFGEYEGLVKLALGVIIFIVGYPYVKNLINGLKDGANINGAVSDAHRDQPALRLSVIQSYASTINEQVKGITNGGYTVGVTLKKCVNAEEVSILSAYYKRTFGESLLTVAKKEMNAFMSLSRAFETLPDYIQNNLS